MQNHIMRITDPEFNRLIVLKKLMTERPLSRTELASQCGLDAATITSIVRDLVSRGLVSEERENVRRPGRPRINLSINPDGGYAIGANLLPGRRLVIDAVNMRGEVVHSAETKLTIPRDLPELADWLVQGIKAAISGGPIGFDQVDHVGIGLSGILDSRNGTIEYLVGLGPTPFPLASVLASSLGIPVKIETCNNLLARSEHWFGDGSDVSDVSVLVIDLGIGAARYHNGELVSGSHGMAAEFGHTKIVPFGGRKCLCGAHGCLQAYCSIMGIVGQYYDATGGTSPDFDGMTGAFREILTAARNGTSAAIAALRTAGQFLGISMANHINMQDPNRIIILAKEPALFDFIRQEALTFTERNILPALRGKCDISWKPLEDKYFSRGAAAMVLEQLYLSPGPVRKAPAE